MFSGRTGSVFFGPSTFPPPPGCRHGGSLFRGTVPSPFLQTPLLQDVALDKHLGMEGVFFFRYLAASRSPNSFPTPLQAHHYSALGPTVPRFQLKGLLVLSFAQSPAGFFLWPFLFLLSQGWWTFAGPGSLRVFFLCAPWCWFPPPWSLFLSCPVFRDQHTCPGNFSSFSLPCFCKPLFLAGCCSLLTACRDFLEIQMIDLSGPPLPCPPYASLRPLPPPPISSWPPFPLFLFVSAAKLLVLSLTPPFFFFTPPPPTLTCVRKPPFFFSGL